MKLVYQVDSKDCGPACLKMLAQFYGRGISMQMLRSACHITREGTSMLGLAEAAEEVGFETLCARITLEQLNKEIALPCVLLWKQKHYVVCYKIKGKGNSRRYYIADPASGKYIVTQKELYKYWLSGRCEGEDVGIAMQIEPSVNFEECGTEKFIENKNTFQSFLLYILPHKWTISQLLFGAIVVMGLGYCVPFLSKAIIDIGVKYRDLDFIMLMILVQLGISVATTSIQFVHSWISLHMHTVIDIQLIASYLAKLSRMPLSFFEIRTVGDVLQRIGDHDRIKSFLMNDLINIFFSTISFLTFSTVLCVYNWQILCAFLIGNTFHIIWVLYFMKYRREIDNKVFEQSTHLQNNLVQFVQGIQEIKVNNIERKKRWEWGRIQARLYKISMRALAIGQIQSSGSMLIATMTNISISYLSARMVVSGEMTLGMLVSLSFIIGQVAAPISAFLGFAQNYQDAKISLERLGDLYNQSDETQMQKQSVTKENLHGEIVLKDISYSYTGAERDEVLHEVSLVIPKGKVTAIVGQSGCGKTTLIKVLQGFYHPQRGTVMVADTLLNDIKKMYWRSQIGTVMQDGYIFSDTIARNIAVDSDEMDVMRLQKALEVANLQDLIERLPLGCNTKIGDDGMGLSQGQKQRILLARCVYKDPNFLFLDEATNALDAKNEKEVLSQMRQFYQGKTVVIVAHRLSTIKHADKIVVMSQGKIVEQGTHLELLGLNGEYANLMHSQL